MVGDIFKKLGELNFPLGEYVVVGGAVTAHGIRESEDLDILVTPKLYQQLKKQGFKACTCQECIDTSRVLLSIKDVDILPNLILGDYLGDTKKLIEEADIINGFPFIKLEELVKFKRVLGREKDFKDIKLIEQYFKK